MRPMSVFFQLCATSQVQTSFPTIVTTLCVSFLQTTNKIKENKKNKHNINFLVSSQIFPVN